MQRGKQHQRQISWLWRIGVICALIFAILSVTRAVFVFFQARTAFRETAAIDDAIVRRKQEIIELKERIAKLQSGEGLEMEARGRLNLQKPNEEVLIIVDDEKKSTTPTDASGRSWWRDMLAWIGIAL